MNLLPIDPLTEVALLRIKTLVSNWAASVRRVTDPGGAAGELGERAAEFFRVDFPRLAAATEGCATGPMQGDPFVAAVFSRDDVSGAVARVAQWAEVFAVPVPHEAAVCLVYQMGQHFAGVMLDALASGSQPGVEPGVALRCLLRRLVPADLTSPL